MFYFALRIAETKDGKGILIQDMLSPDCIFIHGEDICLSAIEDAILSFTEADNDE